MGRYGTLKRNSIEQRLVVGGMARVARGISRQNAGSDKENAAKARCPHQFVTSSILLDITSHATLFQNQCHPPVREQVGVRGIMS